MCSQSDDPTQINKMPCGCLTGVEHRRLIFLKPDHEFFKVGFHTDNPFIVSSEMSAEECMEYMLNNEGRPCANPNEHTFHKFYPPIANNEELDPYNTIDAETKIWLEASIADWREMVAYNEEFEDV